VRELLSELLVMLLGLPLLVAMFWSLFWVLRRLSKHYKRRRRGHGGPVRVRLRGLSAAYPGFWRSGQLDLRTLYWRPGTPWGVPVSLAGARCLGRRDADERDRLYIHALQDNVLTGRDREGGVFQVATIGWMDAQLVEDRLDGSAPVAGGPVAAAGPVRWSLRWLRNRVPLAALLQLVIALSWGAYWLVPLLGARPVDAVVEEAARPDGQCEVTWRDPASAEGGRGHVACGSRRPGEHLPTEAMGWPRTGVVDDREEVFEAQVLTGCFLMFAVVVVGAGVVNRRRLAREMAAPRSPPSEPARPGQAEPTPPPPGPRPDQGNAPPATHARPAHGRLRPAVPWRSSKPRRYSDPR
jgi:hypothetical protein